MEHKGFFPITFDLVGTFATCIHHSCAAERIFSMLNDITDQQQNALEDYRSTAVMLRYNRRHIMM